MENIHSFMTLIFLFSEPFEVCGYFKCNAVKWSEKLFCSCTAVAWCYHTLNLESTILFKCVFSILHFLEQEYRFILKLPLPTPRQTFYERCTAQNVNEDTFFVKNVG